MAIDARHAEDAMRWTAPGATHIISFLIRDDPQPARER
jgi:hypothetical protein